MDFRSLLSDPKQIIVAVVGGIFAVTAAYIRRDKRPEKTRAKYPLVRLLAFPVFYLLLGVGLLAAEFFYANVDPKGDMSLEKPGAILILAGSVFVVAGVVWLPINVVRLLIWPRPTQAPRDSQPVSSSGVDAVPAPTAALATEKEPEKTRAKKPILRLLGFPVLYLLVAAGLLAAAYFHVLVNPLGDNGKNSPSALLYLAGCMFAVAGLVWLPVNVIRLLIWPRAKESPRIS